MTLAEIMAKLPPQLAAALELLDEGDAIEAGRNYLDADEEDQAGMLAFIDSAGPRRCCELRLQHEDGAPTVVDLDDWLRL